jgi:signal peptidase I
MISVGIILLLLAIGPLILYLSAIAVRIRGIKFSRICLTFGALLLLGIAFWMVYLLLPSAVPSSSSAIPLLIFELLVQTAAAVFIVRTMLKTGTIRALGCAVLYSVLAVGIGLAARATIVEAFVVPTSGMSPTIVTGDRILAEKITTRCRPPVRGEIVVFHPPTDPGQLHVKRVLAIAGDRLELGQTRPVPDDYRPGGVAQEILINGKSSGLTTYPFPPHDMPTLQYPCTVPPGKLFLVGDNYNNSSDSRGYGFVDVGAVVGRAQFIYASLVLANPYTHKATDAKDEVGRIRWGRIGKFLTTQAQ